METERKKKKEIPSCLPSYLTDKMTSLFVRFAPVCRSRNNSTPPVKHQLCTLHQKCNIMKGFTCLVMVVLPAFSCHIKTRCLPCFIVSLMKKNKPNRRWLIFQLTHRNKVFFQLTGKSWWCAICWKRAKSWVVTAYQPFPKGCLPLCIYCLHVCAGVVWPRLTQHPVV